MAPKTGKDADSKERQKKWLQGTETILRGIGHSTGWLKRLQPLPEGYDQLNEADKAKYDEMFRKEQQGAGLPSVIMSSAFDIGKGANTVPVGPLSTSQERRPVYVATHPVPLDLTSHVYRWTDKIGVMSPGKDWGNGTAPDPRYHWAVIVGDHFHELNAEWDLEVVYQNGRVETPNPGHKHDKVGRWEAFRIGETQYSDTSIVYECERIMDKLKQTNKKYQPFTNNCQSFVMPVIKKICVPGYTQVRPAIVMSDHVKLDEEEGLEFDSSTDAAQYVLNSETPQVEMKNE